LKSDKFRMVECLALSVVLFVACLVVSAHAPASLLAVSLFKAHLMSLAGWGGYWLDRWAFPYARPHDSLHDAADEIVHGSPKSARQVDPEVFSINMASAMGEWTMIRRALIMVGCLICVGLGA
jgi:hypothetical protein